MNAELKVKPQIPENSRGGRQPSVVVGGAGMSGMLAAIELMEAGITDITIYEKADKVGGTWRDNTYPGLSCDVPAHMYTYSFEKNPDYSRRFAHGPEIFAYFDRVSREYGLLDKIKFNTKLVSAKYEDGKWYLTTERGDLAIADIVICASGVLHQPQYPDIAGIDSFEGAKFHTARWDHSVELNGKKVGMIGSGSTATQITPHAVEAAEKFSLFQRTPQWIYPLPDRKYSGFDKWAIGHVPGLSKAVRKGFSKLFEWTFARAVVGDKLLLGFIAWVCRRNLESKVKDPELREKLRPGYQAACKRMIFANGFYEAIQQDNAELLTEGIERIEPNGVRTKDGRLHELDVLILATGFKPHNFMRPMELIGEDGLTIDEVWAQGAQAHRAVSMPGFPNFFMLVGPNSPIGNYSLIAIAELQMNYIMQLIDIWRAGKADGIAPKAAAKQRYNEEIKGAMKGTIWVTGCQSWYIDKHGNPAM